MRSKNVRFLLSCFALVAGLMILAAPAFAQGVAFQASSLPQQVRIEGVTETVGAVVLQATGPGKIPSGSSITAVYSGSITNSSALANLSCSFGGAAAAGAACVGNGTSVTAPGGAPTGFAISATGNQLTIQFTGTQGATIAATSQMGFATGDYLVISQVRVNVSGLGSGVGTVTATMSGTSAFPASNPITFTQASVPVASVVSPSVKASVTSAGSLQTCSIPKASAVGTATPVSTFSVKVSEQYPAALTSTTDEAGFTPTVGPAPANGSNIGVIITGVPSGVSVGFSGNGTATPGTSTLTLTNTSAPNQTSTGSGSLQWVFTVGGDSTSVAETQTLNFVIGILNTSTPPAFAAGSIPALGTTVAPTATVIYSPIAASTTAPVTPVQFVSGNSLGTGPIASIGDCVTNLLFSFVTNQVGFDSSISISNTTADKLAFSSGNANPQSGTCTLTLYPTDLTAQTATSAGTVSTPLQITTPTIASGGNYTFLQSGSTFKNSSGYLIAVCRFLDAHGFSFVTNGPSATATISQGLLALVIPNNTIATNRLPTGLYAAGGALRSAGDASGCTATVTQSCTGAGCTGTSTATCAVTLGGLNYEALSH